MLPLVESESRRAPFAPSDPRASVQEIPLLRRPTFPTSVLPLLVAMAACGGDGDGTPTTPTAPAVASVDVSPSTGNLFIDETLQLSATPTGAAGETLTGRTVTWNSSDAGVASVSASGLVTAVGVGQADVTATSEGISGSSSITVAQRPVAVVEIDPPSPVDVIAGQTVQLVATTKDDQGNVLTDRDVMWSSGTPAIATVGADGLVTGVAEGSAEVSAASEGVTESVTVNVAAAPPVTITDVTPSLLVEGQAATITGSGFHPTAAMNAVIVDGVAAMVDQATPTVLNITVPPLPLPSQAWRRVGGHRR